MTHSYVWRDSFICVTWLIHVCDMTHSYVWHDSFIYVTWLIHMCDMTHSYMSHDSFICVTWLNPMCDMLHPYGDMTHSYVWHASSIYNMTHSYVWHASSSCNMTHSYVWHASSICVTCLNSYVWHASSACDMPHSYVWHASFICNMNHSYVWHDSFICVTWLIHMCDMPCPYVTWLIHMCNIHTIREKEVSLQEIRSRFEFVPGLFGIVLRGRYLYGAWPRTVLILIEFKFIVPELWQLVVFCTFRILPEAQYCHNTHLSHTHTCHTHTHVTRGWHVSSICDRPHSMWDMTHPYMTSWMRHVTHMNESCHTYECVMSHIWMRHVTHMNESCHTYEWFMSHLWMRHVSHRMRPVAYAWRSVYDTDSQTLYLSIWPWHTDIYPLTHIVPCYMKLTHRHCTILYHTDTQTLYPLTHIMPFYMTLTHKHCTHSHPSYHVPTHTHRI